MCCKAQGPAVALHGTAGTGLAREIPAPAGGTERREQDRERERNWDRERSWDRHRGWDRDRDYSWDREWS